MKHMRGTLVLVGLAPHGLGLRLDAGDAVEDRDRAVEHAKAALDLDGEVDVARRVDDVDAVVFPERRRRRGGDGDAPLALLFHPVHRGLALVDLTDLVVLARVEQDALSRGGLARIDVGHDPDVAGSLEWVPLGHDSSLWVATGWGRTEVSLTSARRQRTTLSFLPKSTRNSRYAPQPGSRCPVFVSV